MGDPIVESAARKGSAELLFCRARGRQLHGYDVAREISRKSGGLLTFHVASLYPLLYKLEDRKWIHGDGSKRPVNAAAVITVSLPTGRKRLSAQRGRWAAFVAALTKAAGLEHA